MTNHNNSLLYRRVNAKGFRPSHVAEVGVWHPNTSNIYQFINDGVRTTLVEPDPKSIALIKSEFGKKNNVTLYEFAACDFNGQVELCKRESSTFVSSLSSSPALVNDDYEIIQADKFLVEARLFNEIDDGTIDLLSIDIEGSEWFVVKNLRSRPTVISLETHGGIYINPHIDDLRNWMHENNYLLWYKDNSDSVYVLRSNLSVSLIDKMRLVNSNFVVAYRSCKKRLRKFVRKFF